MTKHLKKFKLLLDEGFFQNKELPRLNKFHNVTHILSYKNRKKYKGRKISDEEVYKIACSEKRIVVTFNDKDFIKLSNNSICTGIISVSQNMKTDDIDKKILKLLNKSSERSLYGKYTRITNSSDI